MSKYTPRALRRNQRGINLIEIIVAMALGLFLVLGATTLYVKSKNTADVDDSIARLQETARYALSIIETDVRMANFWGLKKDGSDFNNNIDSTTAVAGTTAWNNNTSDSPVAWDVAAADSCGTNFALRVEDYVEATNNQYSFTCAAFDTAATSSDTLTVRRAETSPTAATATRTQICTNRLVARITSGASPDCPPGSVYYNVIASGYYVDGSSDQNPNYPSLRRQTLGVNAAGTAPGFRDMEIIPGVEDMQIELGWDNSAEFGDTPGAVRYVQPPVPATGRIVSVRVWLLIRAEQADPTFTDTRTYTYADRTGAANANLVDGAAYAPNDNFRRLLVSRTYFIRNVTGT